MPSAKKPELTNLATGNTPTFKLRYLDYVHWAKKPCWSWKLQPVAKLGLFSTKNDDFSVPEIDFTAQNRLKRALKSAMRIQE